MATRLVSIELEPGGKAVIAEVRGEEVDSDEAFGRVADPGELLRAGGRSVREAVDEVVVPSARVLVNGLRSLKPSMVEVEFGLKLSGQFGLLFASSEAEGSITVKMTWEDSS